MTKNEREFTSLVCQLRTQLAIATSVLAGDDLTRPEIIVQENREVIQNSYQRMEAIDVSTWWLKLLKPKKYNNPTCFNMLWNQWLHQGYLRGWYSYEAHTKYTKEIV